MVREVEHSLNIASSIKGDSNIELQLANSLIHNQEIEIYDLLLKGANPFKVIQIADNLQRSAYDIAVAAKKWQFVAHILIVELAKKNFDKVKELISKISGNANQVIDQSGYLSEAITPRSTFLAIDKKEESLASIFAMA